MPPLLIAKTGETLQDCARHCGDFEDWFGRGMGLQAREARVVSVHLGEGLPAHGEVSAVVVTGSHAMVTDRAPWSEALAGWLAEAVALGMPVLGVCYGHQLLAHALGGEVDYHPAGPEVGTVPVRLTPAAGADPLLGRLPEAFYVHATHAQSVTRLPPGAVHLAGNDYEPHHAFRVGERAWGVQFHPEFDPQIITAMCRCAPPGANPRNAIGRRSARASARRPRRPRCSGISRHWSGRGGPHHPDLAWGWPASAGPAPLHVGKGWPTYGIPFMSARDCRPTAPPLHVGKGLPTYGTPHVGKGWPTYGWPMCGRHRSG